MNVNLRVFSNNIFSLLSIYKDSTESGTRKRSELLEKLEKDNLADDEFKKVTHYFLHFDWLLIHSFFISAFSYFENFMLLTATQVEERVESKVKLNDIRGKGDLDCYRKFINIIGDIEMASPNSKIWQEISEFKSIRNCIIHEYGRVKKEVSLIKKYKLYYGPGKKMIRINDIKFLEDFCHTSVDYMTELIDEINKKYQDN